MLKLVLISIFSLGLSAKEVMSSFNHLNNGLLPEGVMTFGYNMGRTSAIGYRYNASGSRITNKEFNSKNLDFQDLVDSSKDTFDKVLSSSAFKAFGVNLDSSAGEVQNDFRVDTSSRVYVLGYGLSSTSNLLFIIPTVNVSFNLNSRFNASSSYNKLISDLRSSGQGEKANYLEQIKQNPLKTRLNESGQRLPTEVNSVANLYLNYRKKINTFISDSQIVFPYGRKYSTDDFIDFRINDNSLGFRQGFGYDYIRNSSTVGFYGSYHYRSPFKMDYRIPRTANDPMSSDIEENVSIKYGDQVDFTTQYTYTWNSLVNNYINLRYLYSFKDSYEGNSFSKERYEILENETDSTSVSAQVGVGLNTISSFLQKKFLVPMDFNLQYSKVLYGKNTFDADWVSLNLMVFYK